MHELIQQAKRNNKFDQKLVLELEQQQDNEIKYKSTRQSRKLYEWSRQVGCAIHKTEAFTRLKISEKGILYARIDPEHKVEDIVVNFFAERFPMYVIVLESRRGCFIKKKGQKLTIVRRRMELVIKKLESELADDDILGDLLDFDDQSIWKIFYSSANIMERKNKSLFQKNIPKKYHDLDGLAEEKRVFDGNESLLAFQ